MGRAKMTQYKEDCTKGKSILNPKTYKADAMIQCWCDSRQIAMLSNWLDQNGLRTRHLSDVVKFTLEEVVRQLLEAGQVEMIELCQTARDILTYKYNANLNPGERGKKNVLHNLVLDDRRKSAGGMSNPIDNVGPIGSSNQSKSHLDTWDRVKAEMQQEELARLQEQVKNLPLNEDGTVKVIPAYRPTNIVPERDEAKELLKKVKSITVNSNDDRPRPLTDEELDKREEARRLRDLAQAKLMDDMLIK